MSCGTTDGTATLPIERLDETARRILTDPGRIARDHARGHREALVKSHQARTLRTRLRLSGMRSEAAALIIHRP